MPNNCDSAFCASHTPLRLSPPAFRRGLSGAPANAPASAFADVLPPADPARGPTPPGRHFLPRPDWALQPDIRAPPPRGPGHSPSSWNHVVKGLPGKSRGRRPPCRRLHPSLWACAAPRARSERHHPRTASTNAEPHAWHPLGGGGGGGPPPPPPPPLPAGRPDLNYLSTPLPRAPWLLATGLHVNVRAR